MSKPHDAKSAYVDRVKRAIYDDNAAEWLGVHNYADALREIKAHVDSLELRAHMRSRLDEDAAAERLANTKRLEAEDE